jgi:CRISPR-associated endonuclease/helicase Cas3
MNISLSEAIAKKQRDRNVFQSLEGHTEDSLIVLKDYLLKNMTTLKRFSDDFSLDYELLLNVLYLAIYLHDVGKLTEEFQKNIRQGKPCGAISHPFFSFPFINTSLDKEHKELGLILHLCILSHHSQLYNRIYEDARLYNRAIYLLGLMETFICNAERIFNRVGFEQLFKLKAFPIFKLPEDYTIDSFQLAADIKDALSILKHGHEKLVKDKEPQLKAIYCIILSILKFCDAKASETFEKSELESDKVYQALLDKRNVDFVPFLDVFKIARPKVFKDTPYDYQRTIQSNQNNLSLLISAPCGRGKTEAALSKAINIIENRGRNKIIFALPTQITSNAMYSRLKEIFGDENVGIYHSLSRFVHYLEGKTVTEDDEDVIQDDDISTIVREEKVFLKPVTVTTVDHLVYSLVHGYKQADYSLGNILTSVIIFDEIHYYEHHTLRYIIEAMELLKKLKVPHIAMSGTLPDFIINKLGKEYDLIEDEEGFNFKPFLIERKSCLINEAVDEISRLYEKGERQIIILNTVARAQAIYSHLEKKIEDKNNIILYHSMFTHYDRAYSADSKEAKIFSWKGKENSPQRWILVSTQAIEISVDISCTVIHTEIAPIDAIGQRGGRLNRGSKYHNNKARMLIYRSDNYMPYYFGKDEEVNFVLRTENTIKDGEISYRVIKDWCSQVYLDMTLPPQNLTRIFNECTLFGYSPKEVRYSEEDGNLVKFRESQFIKQDVIPEHYWLSGLKNNPELIMVKVPYWWLRKYPDYFYVMGERYTICTLPYNEDAGFSLENISADDKGCLII